MKELLGINQSLKATLHDGASYKTGELNEMTEQQLTQLLENYEQIEQSAALPLPVTILNVVIRIISYIAFLFTGINGVQLIRAKLDHEVLNPRMIKLFVITCCISITNFFFSDFYFSIKLSSKFIAYTYILNLTKMTAYCYNRNKGKLCSSSTTV